MKKVAVTGASGLVGSHILEKLMSEGVPTVALYGTQEPDFWPKGIERKKADVLDPDSLQEGFADCDTVIHAAGFVSFNPRRRRRILEVNVDGTRNVINACIHGNIRNVVHVSSVAALGRKTDEVANEETKWTGSMASDYAQSKYLAELEAFRGREEGLHLSMVNPSVVLSGTQPGRSSAALFNYVWNENRFFTEGTLNYVDARDVADTVFTLCSQENRGEKFILSAGSISFRDFFSKVAKHLNRKPPSQKVGSTLSYWAGLAEEMRAIVLRREPVITRQSARIATHAFSYDASKAKKMLGITFRPLDETIRWCCEDYMRNVTPNK